VELQALEVSLELAHLSAVGVHRVLFDVTGHIDLVDDDLGASVCDESLDSCDNLPRKIPYYRLNQSTLVIKQ
jgi:hypothetical protein